MILLCGRGMMWEHSTDLEYTTTHRNKRRRPRSHWSNSRSSWTGRLLLRSFLPRSSTGQRSTISSTLRKVADLVSSNLLLKAAMIQFGAMVNCHKWIAIKDQCNRFFRYWKSIVLFVFVNISTKLVHTVFEVEDGHSHKFSCRVVYCLLYIIWLCFKILSPRPLVSVPLVRNIRGKGR